MAVERTSWRQLFRESGAPGGVCLDLRILRKSGEPFFILPAKSHLAARALALYPAQTLFARAARATLSTALRARLPLPLERVKINVERDDPFLCFLRKLGSEKNLTSIAILAGNPRAPGRRFIVLVFGSDGEPSSVVKAGYSKAALELIEKETSLIESLPPGLVAVPKLKAVFCYDGMRAFALQFIHGDSPRRSEERNLAPLLSSWIDETRKVAIQDLPAWQRLVAGCSGDPLFVRLQEIPTAQSVHPVLFHGDFAPWNIKVSRSDGTWTVLDWERGERMGIPGWDWFHYRLQTALLVERNQSALVETAEGLLSQPDFLRYARKAQIEGLVRPLLIAYLMYAVHHLAQSEGQANMKHLLGALSKKWLND